MLIPKGLYPNNVAWKSIEGSSSATLNKMHESIHTERKQQLTFAIMNNTAKHLRIRLLFSGSLFCVASASIGRGERGKMSQFSDFGLWELN